MSITSDYSGIVLNQNATTTAAIPWCSDPYDAQTIYQTFFLPSNYEQGTTATEQRFPDLSGFQVFVQIDAGLAFAATLDYALDYYVIGEGWTNLTQGTVIGCHTDGSAWMDVIFPTPVTITEQIVSTHMRIGITGRSSTSTVVNAPVTVNPDGTYVYDGIGISANLQPGIPHPVTVNDQEAFLMLSEGSVTLTTQQGVSGLWYVNPAPLIPASCEAYLADGKTTVFSNAHIALNFRILGLIADHGTDFLGNEYRSCVVRNTGAESSLNHAPVTSTESVIWSSRPQPSPFAVVSQYFDVRPGDVTPGYSAINLITNGSFEYDSVGTKPALWTISGTGVAPSLFTVENGWFGFGAQAARLTSTFISNQSSTVLSQMMSVTQNQTYNTAITYNSLAMGNLQGYVDYGVTFYTAQQQVISTVSLTHQTYSMGINTPANTVTAPATAAFAQLYISINSGPGGQGLYDVYFDGVLFGTGTPSYFDGDTPTTVVGPGGNWFAQPGRSASGLPSVAAALNNTSVIDGITINPATPNISMSVYYSIDDSYTSDSMTETDWEQKLWIRVPEAYVLTSKQQCMFPTPVHAKYIKLEYTNPQAQTYNPGTFAQPITYKKFPTWVGEYFIAQMENPSFLANTVNVENDALNFAYAYYLDDLDELPAAPVPAPPNIIPTLTNYFNQNNYGNQVDTQTLAQINFIMQQFQLPTGSIVGGDNSSLISQMASNIVNGQQLAPVSENTFVTPIDYSVVSSLSREPVILEQGLPVMYFFLTCRHTYKEISANFEYNRAYFVSIQDVSFLRANYATASDANQYIESGGDTANALIMDFVVDANQNWYTY